MDRVTVDRLASNAADIETLTARVDAIEIALCALLQAQPGDKGLALLSSLANDFEEQGASPGVVAELDLLRGIVGGFAAGQQPPGSQQSED